MYSTTIAVDLAKSVFEVAVSRQPGKVSGRHRLSRRQFSRFLAEQAPATVVMEACGTGRIRPDSGQGAIPKRQPPGVGLDTRTWELRKACPQHAERQIERDGPKAEPPQLRRIAARSCTEIEDRSAGTDALDETVQPQRYR